MLKPRLSQWYSFITLIALTSFGCKDRRGSDLTERAPGGVASTPDTRGFVGPGESIGDTELKININDYIKPVGQPFKWTDDMTDRVMSSLPQTCDDQSPVKQGVVAVAIGGQCRLLEFAAARKELGSLGAMLADNGTNLSDVIENDAGSPEIKSVDAASPRLDLGHIVQQQQGNAEKSSMNYGKGLGLTYEADAGWRGGAKNYLIGSEQFAASATGYFFARNRGALAVHSSADLTGKAFGVQRSLIFTKLDASAENDNPNFDAAIMVFGQEVLRQNFSGPGIAISKNLFTASHNLPGKLRFAVGPVPFSVSWSFRVTGAVPVTVTARPMALTAGINPNIGTTVGLEGSADIMIARAGVGGSLSVASGVLAGITTAQLKTGKDSKQNLCYGGDLSFRLSNLLGGRLGAFAEIGKPGSKLGRIPGGWHGDFNFVTWTGTGYDLKILDAKDHCFTEET
ncbi:MAG: hypothetical protein FJ146_09390 [Deltaproteobacteria bacterium]|nr:hypothetical protein [Deltaproteobacteria bacterium]